MSTYFKKKSGGFTLIELLVVLVIMSLMTLAFVNRQTRFDSATIMRSLAYSVALSVRQAQVYGISVRSTSVGGAASFVVSHGLSFTNGSNYILFADTDGDHRYSTGDTIEQTFKLNNEYRVAEVCAVISGVKRCSGSDDTAGGVGTATTVSILFTRPNPEATIYAFDASSPLPLPVTGVIEAYTSAFVKIMSVSGEYRFVAISNVGQVTVCPANIAIGAAGCPLL